MQAQGQVSELDTQLEAIEADTQAILVSPCLGNGVGVTSFELCQPGLLSPTLWHFESGTLNSLAAGPSASATAAVGRLCQSQTGTDCLPHPCPILLLSVQLGLVNPALTHDQIRGSQGTVAEQRAQLQGLRQQRDALAAARDAAAGGLRQAEAVLRDAHYEQLQQRQRLLEQQAMQVWQGSCCRNQTVAACLVRLP